MGVKVGRVRLETMMGVGLPAAIPVTFVGAIGFVGPLGPHLARMPVGEGRRFFLPASVPAGAPILSPSAVPSKAMMPGIVIPLGIITALVGAPPVVSLTVTSRRRAW